MRLRILRYLDRVTDRRPIVGISRAGYRKRRWPRVLTGLVAALVLLGLIVLSAPAIQTHLSAVTMGQGKKVLPASR